MIEIQFPDQSIRTYSEGVTPFEIASSISEGLARNVLSAKFNGQIVESITPLLENGKIQLFTWNDQEGKTAFWHSSAHVLAQALLALYPDCKLTIGPAIENGFYYDADFGTHSLTEKDLIEIEKKFLEFSRQFNIKNYFNKGVNVSIVQKLNGNKYKARVFERGSGETLACGSAACAITVAMAQKTKKYNKYYIYMKGGKAEIKWNGNASKSVYLYGTGDYVYEGEYKIK